MRMRVQVSVPIPVSFFKEDKVYVAYSPTLDLSTPRKTYEQVEKRFTEAVEILLFATQYLYMRPKMTSERIGLGFAFFHPTPTSPASTDYSFSQILFTTSWPA